MKMHNFLVLLIILNSSFFFFSLLFNFNGSRFKLLPARKQSVKVNFEHSQVHGYHLSNKIVETFNIQLKLLKGI